MQDKIDSIANKYQNIDEQFIKRNDIIINDLLEKIDQKVNYIEFDEQLSNKASKKSVTSALHLKLNKTDFETYMSLKADQTKVTSIENSLLNKLDTQVFNQYIGKMIDDSMKSNEVNKLKIELENKADYQSVTTIGLNIDTCFNSIDKIKLEYDNKFNDINKVIKKLQQSTEMLDSINEFDKSLKSMFDQFDASKSMCNEMQLKFDSLATIEEVKEALCVHKTEFINNVDKNNTDMLSQIQELQESIDKLDKHKADIDSTNIALTQKADAILVEKFLNSKVNVEQ